MKKILVDLKSLITFLLTLDVIFLINYVALSGKKLDGPMFILFSNLVTMVFTYFFTKKTAGSKENNE